MGRPQQLEYVLDDHVVAIAAAAQRLGPGGVEPAVLDEAVVDMGGHHLANHPPTAGWLTIEVGELGAGDQLALQRGGGRSYPWRLYQAAGRHFQPCENELVDPVIDLLGGAV